MTRVVRRITSLMLYLMFSTCTMWAQGGSAGTGGGLEPRFLVDMPTAGMQPKGSLAFDAEFYDQGGMLLGVSVGVFDRLSVGLSYGGVGLIGSGPVIMNQIPGFAVRFRPLEESVVLPALVIGFDSQGRGYYDKSQNRYQVKSPGFFAVLSKNTIFLGYLSLHGGVNYSLENADGNGGTNAFVGAEKTLGPFLSTTLEYNAGLNDRKSNATGKGRGYLNVAVDISFGGGLTLGVNFKDLLENSRGTSGSRRTVRLEYVKDL
jgi:hypothetical protein